jgi:hypothetical protein
VILTRRVIAKNTKSLHNRDIYWRWFPISYSTVNSHDILSNIILSINCLTHTKIVKFYQFNTNYRVNSLEQNSYKLYVHTVYSENLFSDVRHLLMQLKKEMNASNVWERLLKWCHWARTIFSLLRSLLKQFNLKLYLLETYYFYKYKVLLKVVQIF